MSKKEKCDNCSGTGLVSHEDCEGAGCRECEDSGLVSCGDCEGSGEVKTKNAYLELKQQHEQERNDFPMAFAFSQAQFVEGMAKLGLGPDDTDKVYKLGGTGGFYRKADAPKLREMWQRQNREMDEAIAADTTGEGFIFDMFSYELSNHEFMVTGTSRDALDALGLTIEEVKASPALAHGLKLARKAQYIR